MIVMYRFYTVSLLLAASAVVPRTEATAAVTNAAGVDGEPSAHTIEAKQGELRLLEHNEGDEEPGEWKEHRTSDVDGESLSLTGKLPDLGAVAIQPRSVSTLVGPSRQKP